MADNRQPQLIVININMDQKTELILPVSGEKGSQRRGRITRSSPREKKGRTVVVKGILHPKTQRTVNLRIVSV